jgi:hypothetical protein
MNFLSAEGEYGPCPEFAQARRIAGAVTGLMPAPDALDGA